MRDNSARWLAPGDPESISVALATRFSQVFHYDPEGVWFAPGRANLNGEHVDFHGGRCLPMALRHGTYVAAAPRTDGLLRLRTLDPSLDTGIVEIPDVASSPVGQEAPSWTTYVAGVVSALAQLKDEQPELELRPGMGADLLIRSTLPIGAGLSSSASLECAAALAFVAIGTPLGEENKGDDLTRALTDQLRAVLAQVCVRAEVESVGAGTGGLDQTTALRATEGKVVSLDCRDFSLVRTDITFLLRNYRFLAIDTGLPHELADGRFAARRAEAEAATEVLGVERLRDALPEKPKRTHVELALEEFDRGLESGAELGGKDAEACRRRLKHALTEMLRSEQIHRILTGDAHGVDHTAEMIGDIMSAGHTSMKECAEVSFDLADQVVDTVVEAGASGARLIGGGFGGSVLVLVPRSRMEAVTAAASRLSSEVRFLEVVPSPAARAV
ncbi:galactokinase [Nesterenkonia sphaerica]|uniref:Galactokinase n=1 Tax=Nesterenkonia sphaerica TaxID=1804988 RepID=A0A5R9AMV3_9MICC|nr:galactokinase family protein [Nesterenkonia sphaerica]TLP79932.1 galactokinase [Nesterenkonia sphaerica]